MSSIYLVVFIYYFVYCASIMWNECKVRITK